MGTHTWQVPNPLGANPLVAERAPWRSSQSCVTGVSSLLEMPTDSCHFFCTPGNPCATLIVTRGEGSFSYQGVSTRGLRHSPELQHLIFCLKKLLAFLSVFPFFPKGLRVRLVRRILVISVLLLAVSKKNKEKQIRVIYPPHPPTLLTEDFCYFLDFPAIVVFSVYFLESTETLRSLGYQEKAGNPH